MLSWKWDFRKISFSRLLPSEIERNEIYCYTVRSDTFFEILSLYVLFCQNTLFYRVE